MKFATKLIGLVSGIFLVTALSITYFVYTSNLKILEKEIKSNLEAQAFHTMDKIDTMLFERYIDIKTLATDPVISSRSHTPVQILGRLMEYQNDYKYYASLSFFDLNRVSIADTSGLYVGKKRDLAEYWKDIAEGKEFVVNLHRSITLDMVVIHFVHIVRDKNGTPFGVVVSRMPVRQLYDIAGFAAGFSDNKTVGYPMIDLVDKNGLLLYSNSNRAVLKDISPYWSVVKDSPSLGKRPDSVKHAYLGEEEITTFVREKGSPDFHGNGWTLIMVVPTKVAFAPAREMRDKIIFISSGFGILSLVIIFFFSRTISGPLLKLSEASVEIGKGNLGKKVDISTNDEIGQMARAFNKMVTDIEEHVQDQKRSEEALKKSESYIHALFDAIPDAIFRISKDGVYLDYKGTHDFPAMVPPSDFLGKRIQDSMPPEVAGTYMHLIKRAAHTGELQRFDYRLEVDTDQRHYESRIVKSAEDEVPCNRERHNGTPQA